MPAVNYFNENNNLSTYHMLLTITLNCKIHNVKRAQLNNLLRGKSTVFIRYADFIASSVIITFITQIVPRNEEKMLNNRSGIECCNLDGFISKH